MMVTNSWSGADRAGPELPFQKFRRVFGVTLFNPVSVTAMKDKGYQIT